MSAKTIHALSTASIALTDELPFWDISASSTKKVTALNLQSLILGAGILGITYADPDGTVTDHGDTAQPGSIAYICTEAEGSPVLILCIGEKSFPFLTAYTIPTNASLIVATGAQVDITVNVTINGRLIVVDDTTQAFSLTSGKVLTINGPTSIGRHETFTGSGTVAFGAEAVDTVYVDWWPLSASSQTAAVQAAIDAAPDGTTVKLPPKTLYFNVEIDKPIHFEGAGHSLGSSFSYQPYTVSSPVITIGNDTTDQNGVALSKLTLTGGASGQKGILVQKGCPQVMLEKISVSGFSSYGIYIDASTGSTNMGWPVLRDIEIYAPGGSADGLKVSNASFILKNARITNYNTGPGKALYLNNSIAYIDRSTIWCKHGGGVFMHASSIWRCGGDITCTDPGDTLMTLLYTGSGSAATVSITDNDGDNAPDLLTTTCTGASGDNLSINLNYYSTIEDLVDYINYSDKYTAVATVGTAYSLDLNLVSGTNIRSSAGNICGSLGIEIDDTTDIGLYSALRGFGWADCTIKNADGLTVDCTGYDTRSDSLAIYGTFFMKDIDDKPCSVVRNWGTNTKTPALTQNTVTVYYDDSTHKWYLVADFAGTRKMVELNLDAIT